MVCRFWLNIKMKLQICQCASLGHKEMVRLASSSICGVVRLWQSDKIDFILEFMTPGHEIWTVKFVKVQDRPEYSTIVTGGFLNHEIKIWIPEDSKDGWLINTKPWICRQRLVLKSFVEPEVQKAFFNHLMPIFDMNLLMLANARSKDVYAVHLNFGSCPNDTRMDYLSKFTVTGPILSFVVRHDSPEDPLVKLYCVHAKSVKQCTLPDLRRDKSAPQLLPTAVERAPVASTSVLRDELEPIVAREVRALFKPNGSGREAVKECFERSFKDLIIPSFERCCLNMFAQIDETCQRGFGEHTSSAEKRIADHTSWVEKRLDDAFGKIEDTLEKLTKSKVTDSEDSLVPNQGRALPADSSDSTNLGHIPEEDIAPRVPNTEKLS